MEFTKEVIKSDGCTLIIKRPILTEEEREKRIEAVRATIRNINRRRNNLRWQ